MNVPKDMEAVLGASEVLVAVPPAPEPDWEITLVRNCQSGDPQAFRLLVERYRGKVFSIAHSLVRRHCDVEDIAQEVFTKIYFAIRRFDFRSALATWIYKITLNECYDYFRKQRSQKLLCLSEITAEETRLLESVPNGAVSPHRQAEMAQIVALLLEKVSPDERLLLLLKEVEGYSIQDLSQWFGWKENTIKVKLFRARRKLAGIARKKMRRRT